MRTVKAMAMVLLFSAPAWCGEHFELKHLGRLVRVGDPQIAPDGKSIAVVVSRPNYAENRYDAQLVLVDVASQAQRVISDRRGLSQPRWSPSGERLAFLAASAAQRRHGRPLRKGLLQPGDPSALLVDADPGRRCPAEALTFGRQLGDLFGRLDVAAEQDHAAQIELARQ